MSILLPALTLLMASILFVVGYVLKIVQEALGELARDEVKAAIPQLSLGLVRRAAADLPEYERGIAEEWERRLDQVRARPLAMLAIALGIYKQRKVLAAELTDPAPECSGARVGERSGHFRLNVGTFAARFLASARSLSSWRFSNTYRVAVVILLVQLVCVGMVLDSEFVRSPALAWGGFAGFMALAILFFRISQPPRRDR
jgi:hypothetical protein